jgi:hypothetical protein
MRLTERTAGNDNPSFRHGRPVLAPLEAAVKYLLGLHVRDDLTGIRFVPTPIKLPTWSHQAGQ